MSIEKYNPRLEYETIPYVQINIEVIQKITNMEAGFIWVYLQTKPKDWKVIKEHLKNHFNIGNAKLKSIFSYLAKHNLIEYVQEMNEKGHFGKSDIRVLNGSKFIHENTYPQPKNDNNQQHDTGGSIFRRPDNRATGSGLLHIIENTNKRKKRESAPKKRELLSQDFEFDEANQKLCAERKVDPPLVLGKFKAHMKASSKRSADWQAEAELWIMRERPTNQEANPKPNELRSNVKEYGPGHPTWDAMHEWDLKQALKRNSNEGNSIRRANL